MTSTLHKLFKAYYLTTFIGTVFHELAHKKFAKGRGLKIIDVSYFSLSGESLGYVKHSPPKSYMDVFVINVAPFIFNTGIAISVLTSILIIKNQMEVVRIKHIAIFIVGVWLAVSLLLHSFPSTVDITNITKTAKHLWKESFPNILSKTQGKINSSHITIRLLLSPVIILLIITHIVIFLIKHLKIALTLPIILMIKMLSKTRKYGSTTYYTLGIIVLTYKIIYPEIMAIPADISII